METLTYVTRYKIPQDVFMDILRILFRNNIKHKIEGIKEKENTIILQVHFMKGDTHHHQAESNIEEILKEYTEYMEELLSDRTLFMDDDEDDD